MKRFAFALLAVLAVAAEAGAQATEGVAERWNSYRDFWFGHDSVAADPLPVWEKVFFDAKVLFDSNKSVLRPAGRDTLDQFVARIRGLDSQSIRAVGYADRMGSEASNQILSEERVDAVKAYLVGKGIASNRVQASAKGEAQPTTLPGGCKDANNAKNVACMQPDRRVFIEVSGTRIAK